LVDIRERVHLHAGASGHPGTNGTVRGHQTFLSDVIVEIGASGAGPAPASPGLAPAITRSTGSNTRRPTSGESPPAWVRSSWSSRSPPPTSAEERSALTALRRVLRVRRGRACRSFRSGYDSPVTVRRGGYAAHGWQAVPSWWRRGDVPNCAF